MRAIIILLALTGAARAGTFEPVTGFGTNPGALDMYRYVPDSPTPGAGLVVVMHGCTQTAEQMSHSGWNELADEHGFYLVYPQQRSANNPVTCFNWAGEYGDPANLVRGQGENESVRQMVARMQADFDIDPGRVFVSGFSAGGAFAAVMLATWPDVFAAGAIMSGIPYRCATTVSNAYSCQQLASHPELKRSPTQWGDLVRNAHPAFAGPWPRVAIFHGTNDFTVEDDAADELIEQWTDVHGVDQTPEATGMIGAHTWQQHLASATAVVEVYRVAGMGHAVAMGDDPLHACAPMGGTYIEDRDLCAAWRAATFFGLTGEALPPPELPDGGAQTGDPPDAGPATEPGAPAVAIVSPASGEVVSGVVTITATASDDVGIARVEFYVDGVIKGSDGTPPYEQVWQTALVEPGPYVIEAKAFDPYEVPASASITVTVGEAGSGADPLIDPIPCGCAADGRGGAGGGLLGALLLVVLLRRRS